MPEFDPFKPHLRIRAVGDEGKYPLLLDLSNFVYDFNLAYELSRLAVDPKYSEFKFSDAVIFRGGRPLSDEDRLRVEKLVRQSPIELVLLLTISGGGTLAGLWTFVQILEKIGNFQLNSRKLRAEVEKLERENRADELLEQPEEVRRILRYREAEYYIDSTEKRLSQSTVKIKELEIEVRS